jgi:Protein of unknown function (DUF2905)
VLISLGVLLLVAGGVLLLSARLGIPLGRLPGDIAVRGRHVSFYAPIVTCLVLSLALSLLFWLINHFRR